MDGDRIHGGSCSTTRSHPVLAMRFLETRLASSRTEPEVRWDWGPGCQEGPVIPSEEVRLEV